MATLHETATELVDQACKPDPNTRLKVGPQIITFLDGKGKLDARQADMLVDAMTDWLQSSNFKISLMAIDVFNVLVFKLPSIDRHANTILSALLEALKTSNDQVREQVQNLLGAITDKCTPAVVAESISHNGLTHKAWRVREETLVWLISTLDIHGKDGLQFSKILPNVCSLVSDANVDVRDRAVQLVVEIYKNVGERVRLDVEKKNLITDASKRKLIIQKFDEAKKNNLVKVTSTNSDGRTPDGSSALARVNGAAKSASTKTPGNRSTSASSSSGRALATKKTSVSGASGGSTAGALDTSDFQKAFEDTQIVNIYSSRALEEDLTKIKDNLEVTDNDWKLRVNEMKKLRGLFKADAYTKYQNEIMTALKDLTRVLSLSVKDLRSQVSREACISVAYLCQTMGLQAANLAEGCIPNLFSIVPNSAKIIASSGCTALMYIIQYVHSSKLIPVMLFFQTNKSIPCRLQLSRMLEDMLRNWDGLVLDKYFSNLDDTLVKLLSDADEKTRALARKGFFAVKDRFPSRADAIMPTLDPKVQRKLLGELSHGSSVNSLAASRSQSSLGSQESLGGRSVSSMASTRMGTKTTSGNFKKSHSTHNLASSASSNPPSLVLSPPTTENSSSTGEKAKSLTLSANRSRSPKPAEGKVLAVTPAAVTAPYNKYQRKSSPKIGVSSLANKSSSQNFSASSHNLTMGSGGGRGALSPLAQSPYTPIPVPKSKSNSTGRKLSTSSMIDQSQSFLLDESFSSKSSKESGFAEEADTIGLRNTVKRTLGPGDRISRASRMAQSQPASRSGSRRTSPDTSRLNIVTSPSLANAAGGVGSPLDHKGPSPNRTIGGAPRSGAATSTSRRSGIPRSLNASREQSPSGSSYGGTRTVSGARTSLSGAQNRSLHMTPSSASKMQRIQTERQQHMTLPNSNSLHMRMLSDTPEARRAIEHALTNVNNSFGANSAYGGSRNRFESYHSDDDSDLCSLQSFDSRHDRDFENMAEVLDRCGSQNWSERKDGLLGLQSALRSRHQLTRVEIRKATEIFTRMFSDPHVKVLSLFLEVLADFVLVYSEALYDWLGLLLTKLIQKTGAENLLNSGLTKVNKCLEIVREKFPLDMQFVILMKFIADQTQTKTLKVKLSLLKYLQSVIVELTSHEFVNSADTRQALQIILTWSTDKNVDIRRNATGIVTSLFDLNTAEFNALQNALPKKELQHLANNILHQYVSNFDASSSGGTATNSSLNIHNPNSGFGSSPTMSGGDYSTMRSPGLNNSYPQQQPITPNSLSLSASTPGSRHLSSSSTTTPVGGSRSGSGGFALTPGARLSGSERERRLSTSSNRSLGSGIGTGLNNSNLANSPRSPAGGIGGLSGGGDDLKQSLYKTTAEIHKYFDQPSAEGYDSGIPSMPSSNVDLHGDLGSNNRIYNPSHYQDDDLVPGTPDFLLRTKEYDDLDKENEIDDDEDFLRNEAEIMQEDEKLVEYILQELSHHNSRVEQRKSALISLTKLIKEGNPVVWEEHFKMCLMMLFETMGDKEFVIRALVLRVLREFLKHQHHRFQQYAEITILKTLEAHKDSHKDVVRAAEELTFSVVTAIEHARCLQVLCPVVAAGDFPINQTAVKMLTKIIEDSSPEEVETFVEQVCPALMKAYEHQESSVRKDSVYGLVAVHQKVGQAMLDQYTNSLSHGKLKLLKLYISRASGGNSAPGAPPSNAALVNGSAPPSSASSVVGAPVNSNHTPNYVPAKN